MSENIQKLLILFIGILMVGASYVLWSPGSFGLCEGDVKTAPNFLFGQVEHCILFNAFGFGQVNILASPLLFLGAAVIFAGVLSFLVRREQFLLYRKWVLISFVLALAIIYLVPEPGSGDFLSPRISDRTQFAAALLALSSAVGLGVAYFRKRGSQ